MTICPNCQHLPPSGWTGGNCPRCGSGLINPRKEQIFYGYDPGLPGGDMAIIITAKKEGNSIIITDIEEMEAESEF